MNLIIAEKPSVAKTIASVVGANQRHDGYYEGNNYTVTYVYGHMYRLKDVKEYDPAKAKWTLENYPFMPEKFEYIFDGDSAVLKQLKTIEKLIKKATLVINAIDADREGSLIFYELKTKFNIDKPIKRLWLVSQTDDEIKREINNLQFDDSKLEASGLVRQRIDWYIGINLTTLFTIKAQSDSPLRLGRVILATLNLIYEREMDIVNFTTKDIYTLFTNTSLPGLAHYFKDDVYQFEDQESLLALAEELKGHVGVVETVNITPSKQSPLKLFNLTDLQAYVSEKNNDFPASKVLDIAQSLYEKGVITYPRTESNHLTSGMANHVEGLLSLHSQSADVGANAFKFMDGRSIFNDGKVSGHYAIIPTLKQVDLTADEQIVYDAVLKRFLMSFMKPAQFEDVEIILKANNHTFRYKYKNLISEGYLALTKHSHQYYQDPTLIPLGLPVDFLDFEVRKVNKKPPKRYTETTLLKAMQTCGTNVDEDDRSLKGFTIGTPATRADVISKLIDNKYVKKKGKSFYLEPLGQKVVEGLPVKSLLKVEFTGRIEKKLKEIEDGLADPGAIENAIMKFANDAFNAIKGASIASFSENKTIRIGACPLCGKDVLENTKAFSCLGSIQKECVFVLWKESKVLKSYGLKLETTDVLRLFNEGHFIKQGKYKNTLKVSVYLDDEKNQVMYNIVKI